MAQDIDSAWHTMVFTRAWPKREFIDEYDKWEEEKHLPEPIEGAGAVLGLLGKAVVEGLPEAYIATANRLGYYTARNLEGMMRWLNSKELTEAIGDGIQNFDRFNDVDFQVFTGNVYEVTEVISPEPEQLPETLPIFAERFEVSDGEADDFDAWMHAIHLPDLIGLPGVRRVRSFTAVRENIPVVYYHSPGNRMMLLELSSPDEYRTTLRSSPMMAILEDSMRWDRQLSYVKRDVYEYWTHQYSSHGGL